MKNGISFLKKLNKRQLYGILIIGVVLLAFTSKFAATETDESDAEQFDYAEYTKTLEDGLVRVLNRVQGISEAEVMVTLASGFEYVPAYETATDGFEAESEETKKFIVLKKKGGSEEAFVLKECFPEIQGVLVIAKGVESSEAERDVVEAVKTVFNISSNRVKVLEK